VDLADPWHNCFMTHGGMTIALGWRASRLPVATVLRGE
jgi:hypothetical protein